MHILLIAPGIQDYSVEYANAVCTRARITMVAPHRWFADYEEFLDPSVDLRLVDWPRHSSPRNPYFVFRLARLIGSLQPDIVHFLSESVVWLNLVIPVARKYGLVTTMHDIRYHAGDRGSRRVPRVLVDFFVNNSHRVIVHGDGLKRASELHYPRLKGRVDAIPHVMLRRYCNIARKERLVRRDELTINLLFFGRISAYKGLDVLIRSIPLVTEVFGGIKVIVAGQGEDIEPYRRMIADPAVFDIRNRHIGDRETAQLFTDADVVVLPYTDGSQSGVLAIANAFAKPVIVTNVGELGRTVRDDISGLVIPAGDERALADAILKLSFDAALRLRLGIGGREATENAASPELVAHKAMSVYAAARQGT
jgi:glycosyltransferase involved in cell wall biosynthesis